MLRKILENERKYKRCVHNFVVFSSCFNIYFDRYQLTFKSLTRKCIFDLIESNIFKIIQDNKLTKGEVKITNFEMTILTVFGPIVESRRISCA